MQSSTLLVLLSAMSSTVMSSSLPTWMSMAPAGFHQANTVGAAYFMTNEPTGNYLVSSTIGSDGKLALYEAVHTEGVRAHGLPAPPGLDPLFSQGSVGVSPSKRFVANVNAGSNTVSVSSIDLLNPGRLSMIGKPVSSGGEFPTSLAINKAGTRVCVVNAGKVNGVSCYKFDLWEGLIPLKNTIRSLGLNQTIPATGPPSTPSQIIFSQDEKQLIVSVKAGFLVVWDINADGSLSTNLWTVGGGVLPFSLNHIPGKNALVVADPGVGYNIFNLDSNARTAGVSVPIPRSGLTILYPDPDPCPSLPIPNQRANCWSVYSKQSGNFYIIDVGASTFTEVHVTSSLNSTIVKATIQRGPAGPIDSDVATIGKNDFIYSLAANATGLAMLTVNGPGRAEIYQRLDVAGPAAAAKLPINRTNIQGMATFIGF
ncbi:hypothetical protein B0H13DRAFT_2209663 [Mycena leptocephala]|nr:hypothetical protein B0H13DRAFT_2209663 [Mycena leptocephala]